MKMSKIGNIVIVMALLVSAGFAGMLSLDFAVSALLFAALVRASMHLIEKAVNGDANAEELDRH